MADFSIPAGVHIPEYAEFSIGGTITDPEHYREEPDEEDMEVIRAMCERDCKQ